MEVSPEMAFNAPLMVMDSIDEEPYPPFIKEYLLAKNVNHWLVSKGISSPVDSIYQNFKEAYPNSVALSTLEPQYNDWLEVMPGNPAPEIMGSTIDGKKVRLSDFMGKVVYIDVWAT